MGIGKLGNNVKYYDAEKSMDHVINLFNYTLYWLKLNICPIYVFDNKCPEEKFGTEQKRKNGRLTAIEKCKEIQDKNSLEFTKYLKKSFSITHNNVADCKNLLDLMGIPYIVCLGEADPQCAAIYNYFNMLRSSNLKLTPVISNDTDIINFGGTILRDCNIKSQTALKISSDDIIYNLSQKANQIRQDNGLSELEFTHEKYVELTILMGTDYLKGSGHGCKIAGIKIENLFSSFVLNELNVSETIKYLKYVCGFHISDSFFESFDKIKNIYYNSPVYHPGYISIIPKQKSPAELLMLANYIKLAYEVENNANSKTNKINIDICTLSEQIDMFLRNTCNTSYSGDTDYSNIIHADSSNISNMIEVY